MAQGEAFKFCCTIIRDNDSAPNPVLDIVEELDERCTFSLPALADVNSTDEFKNDVFSVYFKWAESSQNATMKLFRCDEEVKTLDNNDYGTFYELGFHQDDGKKYIGYKIDWKKILEDPDLGEGEYYVLCEATTATGQAAASKQSFLWCLNQYQQHRADKTTRLEWTHDGIIGDWEKDTDIYSFDNWYGGLRIPNSIIYNETYGKEYEEREFENGNTQDILNEDVPQWDYQIESAPWFLHRYLSLDVFKAEQILISDYNFRNPIKNMIQRSVKVSSDPDITWNNGANPNGSLTVQMEQKVNRHKKRFC